MTKDKYSEIKYPRYYNVDDIPVIIELDGEEVVGKSGNGQPYPIGKAYVDGYEITKKEYEVLVKKLYRRKPIPKIEYEITISKVK